MPQSRRTSKNVATKASKVLRDPRTSSTRMIGLGMYGKVHYSYLFGN